MFKKDTVFKEIDKYLRRRGHELVLSLFLDHYNGHEIYVRFDYVKTLKVYKIVWVDLHFFNQKRVGDFINMQMMTNILATRVIKLLTTAKYESGYVVNDKIIGDRVEILSYIKPDPYEFVFDRFLPKEWTFLVDPLVIIFSYLPRSMECILNEIFGILDNTDKSYNAMKPVLFDLIKGDEKELFSDSLIKLGRRCYEAERVTFLEKLDSNYIAVVEDVKPQVVLFNKVDDEHVILHCTCKTPGYCKHRYGALLALRNEKFSPFYKVKYIGKEETLLEKVTNGLFYLCFGVEGHDLLLVGNDGRIISVPIAVDNKVMFEVLEDDDDCSLSKIIEDYKQE